MSTPSSRFPVSHPLPPLAPSTLSRRDWCKAALGLTATAAMPFAARALVELVEQRQGWLLLSSDR